MVNNQANSWRDVCILETMITRTASFPHALSAVCLAVCAAILAYVAVQALTGHEDAAALFGAVAGGGLLGRLMRREAPHG